MVPYPGNLPFDAVSVEWKTYRAITLSYQDATRLPVSVNQTTLTVSNNSFMYDIHAQAQIALPFCKTRAVRFIMLYQTRK